MSEDGIERIDEHQIIALKRKVRKWTVIDGTKEECLVQLTNFYPRRSDLEFAIKQIKKYHSQWQIRKNQDGLIAVFVRGDFQ